MSDTEQTIASRGPESPGEGRAEDQAPGGAPPAGSPGAGGLKQTAGTDAADAVAAPPAQDAGPSAAESATEAADEDALRSDVDELVDMAAQRDEYLALAQRTQADFENYRKRVAKESASAHARGMAKLAKELLPALDNLDRALQAADPDDQLLEGVRLARAELEAALGRMGIESFSPLGAQFDPCEHEAMAQQPVDGAESGTVAQVYQAGYRMGEELLRPARVLVAR